MELTFLPGNEVPLDTPLWRYMRLSAFFLLLRKNTVFIPSLHKLQQDDPKEMRIRQHSVRIESDAFVQSELFNEARSWLVAKCRFRDGGSQDTTISDSSLVNEWIHQLSLRRCAWCWFAAPEVGVSQWAESMAMWGHFGREGVAIRTTLRCVQRALLQPKVSELLVAKVEYRPQGPHDKLFDDHEYARRPFLLKNQSYKHEMEVRLVFRAFRPPDLGGILVNVDAQALLDEGEVVVSPYAMTEEALALIEFTREFVPSAKTVRQSAERSPKPVDPTNDSLPHEAWENNYLEPFGEEPDLPTMLREL